MDAFSKIKFLPLFAQSKKGETFWHGIVQTPA